MKKTLPKMWINNALRIMYDVKRLIKRVYTVGPTSGQITFKLKMWTTQYIMYSGIGVYIQYEQFDD